MHQPRATGAVLLDPHLGRAESGRFRVLIGPEDVRRFVDYVGIGFRAGRNRNLQGFRAWFAEALRSHFDARRPKNTASIVFAGIFPILRIHST